MVPECIKGTVVTVKKQEALRFKGECCFIEQEASESHSHGDLSLPTMHFTLMVDSKTTQTTL